MKWTRLALAVFTFFFVRDVSAESPAQKTDAISQLHQSFYKAEKEDDAKRIDGLEDVTGMEWFQMPMPERMDYITASMNTLGRHRVPMRRSMNDYYNAVSETLRVNPGLLSAAITEILASVIYDKEPASREAIDEFMQHTRVPDKEQK